MLDGVGSPVGCHADRQRAVERHRSAVQDVGAGIVVVRVFQDALGVFNDGFHDRLGEARLERNLGCMREILFENVRQNIADSVDRLIARDAERIFRIEDGEGREGGASPVLFFCFPVRNDAASVHFRACCGQRQNGAERQGFFGHCFARVKIPHIPFVGDADSYCLGRVNHASAANGENPVDPFCPAQINPFFHRAKTRVRLDARQLQYAAARSLQKRCDLVVKTGALDAAAAVHKQYRVAELLGFFLQLGQLSPAKNIVADCPDPCQRAMCCCNFLDISCRMDEKRGGFDKK